MRQKEATECRIAVILGNTTSSFVTDVSCSCRYAETHPPLKAPTGRRTAATSAIIALDCENARLCCAICLLGAGAEDVVAALTSARLAESDLIAIGSGNFVLRRGWRSWVDKGSYLHGGDELRSYVSSRSGPCTCLCAHLDPAPTQYSSFLRCVGLRVSSLRTVSSSKSRLDCVLETEVKRMTVQAPIRY